MSLEQPRRNSRSSSSRSSNVPSYSPPLLLTLCSCFCTTTTISSQEQEEFPSRTVMRTQTYSRIPREPKRSKRLKSCRLGQPAPRRSTNESTTVVTTVGGLHHDTGASESSSSEANTTSSSLSEENGKPDKGEQTEKNKEKKKKSCCDDQPPPFIRSKSMAIRSERRPVAKKRMKKKRSKRNDDSSNSSPHGVSSPAISKKNENERRIAGEQNSEKMRENSIEKELVAPFEECPICYEPLFLKSSDDDSSCNSHAIDWEENSCSKIRVLPCNHTFHVHCLEKWTKSAQESSVGDSSSSNQRHRRRPGLTCPICKEPF